MQPIPDDRTAAETAPAEESASQRGAGTCRTALHAPHHDSVVCSCQQPEIESCRGTKELRVTDPNYQGKSTLKTERNDINLRQAFNTSTNACQAASHDLGDDDRARILGGGVLGILLCASYRNSPRIIESYKQCGWLIVSQCDIVTGQW